MSKTLNSLTALLAIFFLWPFHAVGWAVDAKALASLQSYTGLWHMPNARVLPDWNLRIKYGYDDPWRYYGGAIGLWDRLEFHGQFTEVSTIEAFSGEGYGNTKDRSAGARLVLVREDDFLPQVAVGFFDATGNAFFGSRYIAASKMFGPMDITVGLGQGILAGEYVPETFSAGGRDRAFSFLTSSPFRRTRPFVGLEYHISSDLTFTAEYSSIDYSNMYGMRASSSNTQKKGRDVPVNIGFKYQLSPYLHTQVALMGGDAVAAGISAELPFNPEGMLPWKKPQIKESGEGDLWRAHLADNDELAELLGQRIKAEGFSSVVVRVAGDAVWVEARNTVHLSDARAMGRMGVTVDRVLPERIATLYLNLKERDMVVQSLRTSRAHLRAYLESRTNTDHYLVFSNLELYGNENRAEFMALDDDMGSAVIRDKRYSISLNPRLRTFLNNRRGFFKHKGLLEVNASYDLWAGAKISTQLDLTLFNQWDELAFNPLEPSPTATDVALYERESDPRLSMLALDQYFNLPWNVMGRASVGIFQSAYMGFGGEAFRYFHDGLWGIGVEAQAVRKRDIKDNFALRDGQDDWYCTAFLNIYAQLWPSQGVEGGLKIGRFLGGDPGVRFELRRSFKYFTVGGYYTITDTSRFQARENREDNRAGVYISFPLALFKDSDLLGHLRYTMTSFTRDTGQTVRQPSYLYPMDPWSTPDHTRRNLEDMRIWR